MQIQLHSLSITLHSRSRRVNEQWRILFDYELERPSRVMRQLDHDICIEAEDESNTTLFGTAATGCRFSPFDGIEYGSMGSGIVGHTP
jgi:hypothetical protein